MDDQELDRLYTAVRDHKAAYEAAVAVIGRQNEELAALKAGRQCPAPAEVNCPCPEAALARVQAVLDRYDWYEVGDRIPGHEIDDALKGIVRGA